MKTFYIGFRGTVNYWLVKALDKKAALEAFHNFHGVLASSYTVVYRKEPQGPYNSVILA